jgi:hypothetical protein
MVNKEQDIATTNLSLSHPNSQSHRLWHLHKIVFWLLPLGNVVSKQCSIREQLPEGRNPFTTSIPMSLDLENPTSNESFCILLMFGDHSLSTGSWWPTTLPRVVSVVSITITTHQPFIGWLVLAPDYFRGDPVTVSSRPTKKILIYVDVYSSYTEHLLDSELRRNRVGALKTGRRNI